MINKMNKFICVWNRGNKKCEKKKRRIRGNLFEKIKKIKEMIY